MERCRLYAITPGRTAAPRADLRDAVRAALEAGVDHVVLREPALPVWLAWDPRIILHASMPGAAEVAARDGFGLHLPGGAPVPDTRGVGPLGVSAHSEAEVAAALAAGADYVFLSPVWRAGSKPGDERPTLGLGPFARVRAVALGGVTVERAAEAAAAGAVGVAVLTGIFGEGDVRARVRAYLEAIRG